MATALKRASDSVGRRCRPRIAEEGNCGSGHTYFPEMAAMSNKKPAPLLLSSRRTREFCPVCGTVSYSREGIHPQCAQQQADAARMEVVKKAQKNAPPKPKMPNPLALSPWHKRCPKCRAEVHVRKMTCPCGHEFRAKG